MMSVPFGRRARLYNVITLGMRARLDDVNAVGTRMYDFISVPWVCELCRRYTNSFICIATFQSELFC